MYGSFVSVHVFLEETKLTHYANSPKSLAPLNMFVTHCYGRAIAQAVSRQLPTAAARVRAQVGHVGLVVDRVVWGQVFSEYLGFPCQFLFRRVLRTHHLSSGAAYVMMPAIG
jgi:hypothetical protein